VAKTTETWFSELDPAQFEIAESLRARIERAGPGLTCKLAWGFPCWSGTERIFSIAAYKDRCNLQIFYGAELAPSFPDRIEGTGKALRHVKIHSVDQIDAQLDQIIEAAIRLDATDPRPVR
jgi:hypothetical protein